MTPLTGKDIDDRFNELAANDAEYQRLAAVDARLRTEVERTHKAWEEMQTYAQRAHAHMALRRRELRQQARREIMRVVSP